MENIEFSKNLIKGKIAEIIFERMIEESKKYTILRFGYEYTVSQLAQYHHLLNEEAQKALNTIRHAPDFVLISENKSSLFFVEVKYQSSLDNKWIKIDAEQTLGNGGSPWLFVATPNGFFFEPCHTIIRNEGVIDKFNWVNSEIQEKYLKLLNEFEGKK